MLLPAHARQITNKYSIRFCRICLP